MDTKVVDAFEKLRTGLNNGKYHTIFDAMSVSSLELDKIETVANITTVNIIGLEKLTSDIVQVLNSGVVDQQAILALAKEEYSVLTHVAEKVRCDHDAHDGGHSGGNVSWDTLPDPLAHDMPKRRYSTALAQLDLPTRLQKVHDDLHQLMESKLCAFEFIETLMMTYSAGLSALASSSSHLPGSEEKVQRVVEPRVLDLMTHRFLNTAETREAIRVLRELASSTYMRGSADLAACKFTVENRKLVSTSNSLSGFNLSSFKIGSACVLLLWAVSECFNNERMGRDVWHDPTFSIFICLGDLTLLLIMWGVSLRVWRLAGINYIKLLSMESSDLAESALSYRPEKAEHIVLNSAADLTLVYLTAFILFNKALRGSFSLQGEPAAAHAIPAALLVFYVVKVFFPLKSRRVYLEMLWKVLAAPGYPVVFRDSYVGDLLTSLVRVSVNFSYSLAYVILTAYWWVSNHTNRAESVRLPTWEHSTPYRFVLIPILTILPLWLRLMQCLRRSVETGKRWPHYFNALKYCSAMVVFSFAAFRPTVQSNPLWILGLVGATSYQFVWDLTMDWGLIQVTRDGNVRIRRERSMFSDGWYAAIAAFNFLLRFSWAITFLPNLQRYSTVYWYVFNNFQTLMAAAEVVRRMVWGFLRLEWEHIESYGSAPVSPTRQDALRRERASQHVARGVEDEVISAGLPCRLDKMPLAGESSTSFHSAFRSVVEWEWVVYFTDWCDHLLTSSSLISRHASGHSFSTHVWIARIIEACSLAALVLIVIAVAALG